MQTLTPDEAHYEKYLDVALNLLMAPDEPSPSARALVERLGGSLTTANKAMRVFWGYVGRQLNYRQQYPDGMPEPIIKLTEQLMASARETAALELGEERRCLATREQTLNEHAQELQATIEDQRRALESLHERLHSCEHERDKHSNEQALTAAALDQQVAALATVAQENDDLRLQLSRQHAEYEQLQARTDQLEQDRGDYRVELSALHERLVSSEKQSGVLDAQRAAAIARHEEVEARLSDLHTQLNEQKRQRSTQQATIDQLHSAAAAADAAGLARDQEYQRLADSHQQLQDTTARERGERDALAADHQRLQLEQGRSEAHRLRLPGMEQQIEDLRAERDRLLLLLTERITG